jgi:hypothetical protein
MARMIAAKQERPFRDMVTSLDYKGAIRGKKHPAKIFKRHAAHKRCPNRTVRAVRASHSGQDISDLEHHYGYEYGRGKSILFFCRGEGRFCDCRVCSFWPTITMVIFRLLASQILGFSDVRIRVNIPKGRRKTSYGASVLAPWQLTGKMK